jgi:hypothetical protein
MTQQQLIQRLKQQPKQSSLADLAKDWDAIKGVATSIGSALADLTQYGTQATEAIAQLSATMIKTGEKGFKGLLNESVALQLGMAKVLDVNDTLMTAFKDTAKAATFLERKNSVLNKGFGISSKNSQKLAKELNTLSKSISGNTAESQISTDSMMKYAVSIKTMLPTLKQAGNTSTQFYTGLQQSQHILQASLGLTEEQANAFTQFGAANAENAARQIQFSEQVAKQMGDTDGSMGYLKMITEGIAEAGEEIQLQYGRLPGSLERATIKASRLGLKLEHLSEAGSNLLDIETSIGQELEYQLLTGRQLTDDQGQSLTNLYREATLRGDANKQANILSDIIAEEGETLENNLFARKQMAELLGLQENELAAAIQKQKILEKAGEAGLTINLDDEGAISKAAAALRDQGALSQKEFETFQKQNDTRTTDDLLKEQLLIAEESIIYQKLNAMSMRDELFKAAQEMSAAVGQNAEMSEEQLQALGKAFTVLQVPRQTAQEIKQSATAGTITPRYDKQNDVMIPLRLWQ